jgi:cytochrome c5
MKRRFVLLVLVIASLIATQCGGTPPATEVPATTVPATEAATATEVPPTGAPATEAPTATEAPPTEVPTATEVPPTEEPATEEAPAALEGQSLLEERCTVCHGLGGVERAKKTEEEWKTTVERMVGKGAQLDEAEQELLIQYLAETYPK